jgi:hypothetical protein
VPDWDNTESRERDEDAAWRDLVARFDAPLTAQQPVPWPAREDMTPAPTRETGGAGGTGADGKHRGAEIDGLDEEHGRHAADIEPGRHTVDSETGRHAADSETGPHASDTAPGLHAADGKTGPHAADAEPGSLAADGEPGQHAGGGDCGLARPNPKHESDGLRAESGEIGEAIGRHGRLGPDGATDPDVIQVPRRIRGPVARGVPADGTPTDDEEHFIPPTPPPLPKLDPVAKGAWAALFGGPGYLMVATAAGWSVSGLAAFCAVAAFVAGFAILVLRMHERGPGGPDDGDDGAVV